MSDDSTPISPVTNVSRSSTAASTTWTNIPPFEESDQLSKELKYICDKPDLPRHLCSNKSIQALPDAPRIKLDSCRVVPYCLEDLDTPSMNKLGEKLLWAGPSLNIKPLSEQLTISRKIQITEDVSLHCVWADDIIFLKPLPSYLCSYAFWVYILDPSNDSINPEERNRLKEASLGFLRSYSSLIRHRSDFNIARRNDLLASFGTTTFEEFVKFIMSFDELPDSAVSSRWRFGELVLDALNFHSAIILHKWHRNRFESRYAAYFQRFFPVILFIFAMFSVMLSAMQVIIGAQEYRQTDNKGLKRTIGAFIWFGTEAIGWSVAFGGMFVVWWIAISTNEAWKRHKMQKKWKKKRTQEASLQP